MLRQREGEEVSAVFRNDSASGLIQGSIEKVGLDLRNVDRWERATEGAP
jgi:hypothetical protein